MFNELGLDLVCLDLIFFVNEQQCRAHLSGLAMGHKYISSTILNSFCCTVLILVHTQYTVQSTHKHNSTRMLDRLSVTDYFQLIPVIILSN